MKKFIYLLFILSFTLSISAQEKKNKKSDYSDDLYHSSVVVKKNNETFQKTSGQYMQQASKDILIGVGCGVAGGLIAGGSALVDSDESKKAIYIAGGTVAIIGVIFSIKGVITIGKAGRAMDRERNQDVVYITPSQEGLGLKFTF